MALFLSAERSEMMVDYEMKYYLISPSRSHLNRVGQKGVLVRIASGCSDKQKEEIEKEYEHLPSQFQVFISSQSTMSSDICLTIYHLISSTISSVSQSTMSSVSQSTMSHLGSFHT